MSRYYSMVLNVSGHNQEKSEEIMEAANKHWEFDDWSNYNNELSASGESSLTGGESEEEFAERITEAIWKANGKFCTVQVDATYLEDLPCETYSFDEEDYQRFVDMGE